MLTPTNTTSSPTDAPIVGYRLFFPNNALPPEDYPDVDSAWARKTEYEEQFGAPPYVHTIRLGGPEFPTGFGKGT
jgi:hypothetical protein